MSLDYEDSTNLHRAMEKVLDVQESIRYLAKSDPELGKLVVTLDQVWAILYKVKNK